MKKEISYKELIEIGKRIFNFSPDEDFSSTAEIIEAAHKSLPYQNKDHALSVYAEYLAHYCDKEEIE